MLANGTTIHFGDMNIQGKVQIYKDVDIKGKLTINGQEVFLVKVAEETITAVAGMACTRQK